MSIKMKIAFGCYLVAMLIIAVIAVIYLFTPQLLPYQEKAIGIAWEDLTPGLQTQFLSLLKVAGGGYLTTAIALAILLFIPFKQGYRWARWAIPMIGVPSVLIVNYAGLAIILNTPGRPPLIAGPVVVVLMIIGLIFSGGVTRKTHAKSEQIA